MNESEWHVARLAEIEDPGAMEFSLGEGDWPFRGFVVRWKGEIFAYENVCPHAGHPLNMIPRQFFNMDHSLLICSSHGAVFEPDSGTCVAGPCAGVGLKIRTRKHFAWDIELMYRYQETSYSETYDWNNQEYEYTDIFNRIEIRLGFYID